MSTQTTAPTTASTTTTLPLGTWQVDPVHSSVEFHVKHLGIATVKGVFTEFAGTLEVAADGAHGHGVVQAQSVETREPARDEHLRSADFFDVERYPQITFASTAIRPSAEADEYELEGDLTIHGVTRRVTLATTLEGTEVDMQGNDRVALSAHTQISRSDFEMRFNAALGSGNVVVSDKVKLLLDVSLVRSA